MPEIPAEAVRAVADAMEAEDNVRTFFSFSAMAKVALAALAEQGYVIVRAEDIHGVLGPKRGVRAYIEAGRRLLDSAEHPAQPSGTLQDVETSGDGTSPQPTSKGDQL